MIDLNRIRSLKTLENMKETLTEFIVFDPAVMKSVYIDDYKWSEDDYEADKDTATHLLELVERRIKSLGRHLSKVSAEK